MKQMIKKMAVVLSVVLVCAPMGAMAANKLIVKDAGGTADKFVVTDDNVGISAPGVGFPGAGYVGIGTKTPASALNIKSQWVTSSTILLEYTGNPTYNKFNNAEMRFARNNMNAADQNNGLALITDRLGFFSFGTMINAAFKQSAGVYADAAETHTTSSYAGNLHLVTTPPGGTVALPRVIVTSTGNVGVGTTTPKSKLHVVGLLEFADNAAALTGGLTVGAIYRTGDVLKVVH